MCEFCKKHAGDKKKWYFNPKNYSKEMGEARIEILEKIADEIEFERARNAAKRLLMAAYTLRGNLVRYQAMAEKIVYDKVRFDIPSEDNNFHPVPLDTQKGSLDTCASHIGVLDEQLTETMKHFGLGYLFSAVSEQNAGGNEKEERS